MYPDVSQGEKQPRSSDFSLILIILFATEYYKEYFLKISLFFMKKLDLPIFALYLPSSGLSSVMGTILISPAGKWRYERLNM